MSVNGRKGMVAQVVFTGMMRLHSLQSVDEEGLPFEVDWSSLRNDAALRMASGPESMPHRAPWLLWIRAKIALSILAHMKAGRRLRNGQVHYACFIRD